MAYSSRTVSFVFALFTKVELGVLYNDVQVLLAQTV